jgi:uncharacterized membrane protein YfcA
MEVAGYISAVIIGLSLGLIGGGGSILTVPVMVYLFGFSPVLATAYSLFIVGVSALFGTFKNIQKGLINYRIAIVFAIPSFITVFLTRRYFVPWMPEVIFSSDSVVISKSIGIMVLFAVIMLLAAWSMIKSGKTSDQNQSNGLRVNIPMIILEGVLVGFVTGIVGAGGGFLIIPVLVLMVGLPMKQAVGTSLLIIAAKSLFGFVGDLGASQEIDWMFLGIFTALAVVGISLGVYLSKYIPGAKLKTGFGWFVLIMAIYILTKELILP